MFQRLRPLVMFSPSWFTIYPFIDFFNLDIGSFFFEKQHHRSDFCDNDNTAILLLFHKTDL